MSARAGWRWGAMAFFWVGFLSGWLPDTNGIDMMLDCFAASIACGVLSLSRDAYLSDQ